jgi:multiple sugar transport system ATP-binding protein
MAEILLQGVTKVFRDGTEAVSSVDLEVSDGELVVLVGPSGCGKTTLLRMVAGLEDITAGTIWIGERVVNDVPPGQRDVAMVFQNYALYPHMSVYQNMALSLKIRKLKRREINRRVEEAAAILRLEDLLQKSPRELSGGQRQRVAMGRAIVREPHAFLMDEPLSNLDAKLRVEMRTEILRIQQDLRVTTVYVTHDQTEAMTLGDRVAVLRRGVLQQLAPPQELYLHPANLFVAGFIGSPAMNLVEATLKREGDDFSVEFGSIRLPVSREALAERPRLLSFVDRKVIVGIRPEDMEDAAVLRDVSRDSRFPATVDLREDMGAEAYLHFAVDAPPALTDDTRELASDLGSEKLKELRKQASERRSRFVVRASPESRAAISVNVDIFVDTRKLHFFDPVTGEAIAVNGNAVHPRPAASVPSRREGAS